MLISHFTVSESFFGYIIKRQELKYSDPFLMFFYVTKFLKITLVV